MFFFNKGGSGGYLIQPLLIIYIYDKLILVKFLSQMSSICQFLTIWYVLIFFLNFEVGLTSIFDYLLICFHDKLILVKCLS